MIHSETPIWLAHRRPPRTLVVLVVTALIGLQLISPLRAAAVPGTIKQRTATTVTADGLPTAQINGVVWSQVTRGDTVFAGGQFTSVRPAGAAEGSSETPRANMMAYDLKTGAFSPTFAPTFNGPVKVVKLSADQKTLYVGGTFTQVNGVARQNFAAISVASGALTNLAPKVNNRVNAIAVIDQTIYLGGTFNRVVNTPVTRLAAVNAVTGQVSPWAPTTDGEVQALVASPDKSRVIIGGSFSKIGAGTALGMGSVDAVTGAPRPWKINTIVKNGGVNTAILTLSADGDTIYGGGFAYGEGNFEGAFAADPTTGNVKWLQDCHGDTYSVAPIGDKVYTVGHAHFCSNIGGFNDTSPRAYHRALVATKEAVGTVLKNLAPGATHGDFGGQPSPSLYNWFPELNAGTYTGKIQGPWSVTGNANFISLGGEFTRVNDKRQQGLVRMALPAQAPLKVGPGDGDFDLQPHKPASVDSPPVATPAVSGKGVVIRWKANWDPDDTLLTYRVVRNGAVIRTFTATSVFWKRQTLSYTDLAGSPGALSDYAIRVSDPSGNSVTSLPLKAVPYPSDTSYAQLIKTDLAVHQWRLGSPPGQSTDPDAVGQLALTRGSAGSFGAPGAIAADSNTAAGFVSSTGSEAHTAPTRLNAGPWSVESWFKTSSQTGGAVVGVRSRAASGATLPGNSQVYLNASGRLSLAVHQAAAPKVVAATTTASYNNNKWHHVVAVRTGATIGLYVDGALMAVTAVSQPIPAAAGAWSVGGRATSDVPNAPVPDYAGAIDEVSVFASALTAKQIRNHYLTGKPRTLTVRPK